MTLSSLIRKRDTGSLATAIPAIPATQQGQSEGTVARIATVAVANPKEGQPAKLIIVGAADMVKVSRWLLHFIDRESLEVVFSPEVTHAAALDCYPNAVAAEPQAERYQRTPTETEAQEITTLAHAVYSEDSETDRNEALIAALADPDGALLCYRAMVEERGIALIDADDERRRCTQCLNLRGRNCTIAQPGGLESSGQSYQPMLDVLHRCAGYQPRSNDADQRSGNERWPGLITKGTK